MKVGYLILCILLATILMMGCHTPKRAVTGNVIPDELYLSEFKLTYLRQFLEKSYNNSSAIREIIRSDHSGFAEPILSQDDHKLIDSLTSLDNQRLIADSVVGDRRAEGTQGKRPLGYLIERMESKWLDSVARARLKISLR